MKRRIFSVLFALVLVLSLGLVTAVPAAADPGTLYVRPYTLEAGANGTSVWSTAQQHTGSASVLLTHADNVGSVYVDFVPPAGETLATFQADITAVTGDWSFWHYTPNSPAPSNWAQFELYFDDPDSTGFLEVTAVGLQNYTGTVAWVEEVLAGATPAGYGGWGEAGSGASFFNWGPLTNLSGIEAAVNGEANVTNASDWVLTRVRVELWEDIVRACYIDDIQIAGVTYYGLIQDAIDTATTGDTINVAAGTYTENVDVDKALTLTGASSSLVTVISSYAQAAFLVTAANVEISGFTMTGTGIDPAVNLPLAGVYIDSVDGCTISDNVMVGESHGVYLDVGSNSNTITRNNASDNNQGFTVEPYNTTGTSTSNIFTDNIANECWKYGFFVEDGVTNTFTGNTVNLNPTGFKFVGANGTGNTLNYNDITGNLNSGVTNSGTPSVDALYNYWGDESGPTVTTNARGAGDSVTVTTVTYEPWLHTTQATVYPSGTRYYAYNWCDLTTGWNIWSTPIAMDAQADTWGEYKVLGVDLDMGTGANAYYFDASTPAWASVTDAYVLSPCDAIYIKVASNQEAPILFSPNISAPAKALYPGWNLVSASFINSMDSPTIATGDDPENVLASVYTVPGPYNTGYSMVVSPAVNQTAWTGYRGTTIDAAVGGSATMLPCKGYWVYMTNGGTLAGTVFTPVSPLQ